VSNNVVQCRENKVKGAVFYSVIFLCYVSVSVLDTGTDMELFSAKILIFCKPRHSFPVVFASVPLVLC
jgi:hypothetical protein